MSASLPVFVTLSLFFVVASLCFVGCVLDRQGTLPDDGTLPDGPTPTPFTTYSDSDILSNPDCVAYWPLSDSASDPTMTAVDAIGKMKNDMTHYGTYASAACPPFNLVPGTDSAGAPGTQTIGAPGIVQGDRQPPQDANSALTTCMQVNGGYVSVPYVDDGVVNQTGPFSIEAWVQREWDDTVKAFRVFIDSRDLTGAPQNGFALWVNEDNNWEAWVGLGADGHFMVTAGSAAQFTPTHVVLTCDGINAAALWIDGKKTLPATPPPPASMFAANTAKQLAIGAGGSWLEPRPTPMDTFFFPSFPFNGKIQDVAIYNDVLDDNTIINHSANGKGNPTD